MNGNQDFRDLLQCLNETGARYLIVGAYAVIYHTEPRYTKDLDIWVDPAPENAEKVWGALAKFGAPLTDLTVADLSNPDVVFQMGVAPNRMDIIVDIEGLHFEQAWARRVCGEYDDQPISLLCLEDILHAKQTAGREHDLIDAKRLRAAQKLKE